jgi:hypothetical protein
MAWMLGDDDSIIILPFEMYEADLKNKVITVEEILNGKNNSE